MSTTVEFEQTTAHAHGLTNITDIMNVTSGPEMWEMPLPATIIAVVFLATNLAVGLSANCLLIIIINYSPTLKTPANSHLINICANNLILCGCMVISLVSILLPGDVESKINILTGFHVFLESNCLLQYWGTFASIGYYRSKIIHCPSVSVRRRQQIITRCLTTSWVVSLVVSLMVCLSHLENDEYACLTLNPFQKRFVLCHDDRAASLQRTSIILIKAIVFCVILVVIVVSYYRVFRSLRNGRPLGKNRVFPDLRTLSLQSDFGDAINTPPTQTGLGNYGEGNAFERTPYTVSGSGQNIENDFVVHYQRNGAINVLSFEDIIALENPILASNLKRQGQQKLFTKLTFYLNAPIYPLWYLIQNRRVRKCLVRVFESLLLKIDFRN